MTKEEQSQVQMKTEKSPFFDKLLRIITLGHRGVDEDVLYGYLDDEGNIFAESPIDRSMMIGKTVYVPDMSKTRHIIERRTVKLK